MEKIKEIRHNLQQELHAFHDSKPHPYASLVPENTTHQSEDFDPIVRISSHHDRKTHLKQPDLNLAEYYYESMNEADNEAEMSSNENEISMTRFTAKVIPPPPTTHLIFDHHSKTDVEDIPPPIPSPPPPPAATPIEQKEIVDLNFYKVMDEADPDPKLSKVREVIEIYKTPPVVPKRNDSIACNIEKYFNTELIKKGEEDDGDNMELIEERILAENEPEKSDATSVGVCDTDDQFEDIDEDFPAPPEMAPCSPVKAPKSPVKTSKAKQNIIDETDDPFARAVAKGRGNHSGGAVLPAKPKSARSDSVSGLYKICPPRQPRPKPVKKQDPNKLRFAELFAFCQMDEGRRRDALGKVMKL